MAILQSLRSHEERDEEDSGIPILVKRTSGPVFTMPDGRPLSENTILHRCQKDGLACTPHGMRTSFRGWCKAVHKARFEAIELSLSHHVGNSVTQAYDRDDLLEERRELMQGWADFASPSASPF